MIKFYSNFLSFSSAMLTILYAQNSFAQGTARSVSCDVYMNDAPLTRTTGNNEFNIASGVFSGAAERYTNATGTITKVTFWGRANTASNTAKVTIYSQTFDSFTNSYLPGSAIGSPTTVVIDPTATAEEITAVFTTPVTISNTNIIVAIEPTTPATDDFFILTNNIGDAGALIPTVYKQGVTWYQNPAWNFDFLILPVVSATITSNYTFSTNSLTATFTNTSSGTSSYSWDFGDGGTSVSVSPAHTYASAGTYDVKLVSTTSGACSDSVTKQVTVVADPCAGITITPDYTFTSTGLTVDFTNASSGANTYLWDFGDGNTSVSASPSHTYSTANTYDVKLVAYGSNVICSDSVTKSVVLSSVGITNPNSSDAKIKYRWLNNNVLSLETSINGKVIFYNTLGQNCMELNLIKDAPQEIDLSSMNPGVYFISATDQSYIKIFKN